MRYIRFFGPIVMAAVSIFYISCSNSHEACREVDSAMAGDTVAVNELGIDTLRYECVDGVVQRGDFFSSIITSYGRSVQEAINLSAAVKDSFDVRSIKVGNCYSAYIDKCSGRLDYWVYHSTPRESFVLSVKDTMTVRRVVKPVQMNRRYTDITITYSLWQDMIDAGASPLLALKLSEIYAWTVDFFALQPGDRFRVLYDEVLCDGEFLEIGPIQYAEFVHMGDVFPSVMFDQGDGGNVYWNDKGESMRKAFLKAPLSYSRISSGFSYNRRHPITRRVSPHTGVDYAAPSGTPVVSIGDGVVIERQYRGNNGNIVKIRHNSVYTSAYLHLRGFAKGLKVGQRVTQGQLIGYVGSTGRSTGPHLDFRIWKNGTPINPLTMESPSAEPLKKENTEAFEAVKADYMRQIDRMMAESLLDDYLKATVCR